MPRSSCEPRRQGLLAVATALAVVVVLAGCRRDPEPPPIVKTAPSEVVSGKTAPAPTGPVLSPDGKPDCAVVMTIPALPTVSAKVDGGIVRLVVSSYSELPLSTSLTVAGGTLSIAATPAGPAETFCRVPFAIRGVRPGDYEVVVTIPHTLGPIKRPTDVLRAKVTVPGT